MTLLAIIAAVYVLFTIYRHVTAPKYTQTAVLYKTTDDGENITVQFNFTDRMSHEEKLSAIHEAFTLGEDRLKFVDARFKAHLASERAKQEEETKLKLT